MPDLRSRLTDCFAAVFPDLGADEIQHASVASVAAWDSLATVTLVGVIEEEFGEAIGTDDLADLVSFELILDHLTEKSHGN